MRYILVALAFLLSALLHCIVAAQEKPVPPLVGHYTCYGTNPDGSAYRGVDLTIEPDGELYGATWTQDGKVLYRGIGLFYNGAFAVSTGRFVNDTQVTLFVFLYMVDATSGGLVGKWTSDNRALEERCWRPGMAA